MSQQDILTIVLGSSVIGAVVAAVIGKLIDFRLKDKELSNGLANKLIDKKVEDFEGIINLFNRAKRFKTWREHGIDQLGSVQKCPIVFANTQSLTEFKNEIGLELDSFLFKSKDMSSLLFEFYDIHRILLDEIAKRQLNEHTVLIGIIFSQKYRKSYGKIYKQIILELHKIYSNPLTTLEPSRSEYLIDRSPYEKTFIKENEGIFTKALEVINDTDYSPNMFEISYYGGFEGTSFFENEDGDIKPPSVEIPDFTSPM